MAKKSLFQKIMDSLFDEVIIEEEIDEPIKTEEVKLPPVSSVVKEKKAEEIKKTEIQVEEKAKEVVKKESRSTMISVDDLKEPEKIKKTAPIERKPKTEYEFTKVISPIFGVIKDNTVNEKEAAPTLNTKKTTAIKNKSVLGTVISPIYGIAKEETEIIEEKESMEDTEGLSLDDLIESNEVKKEEALNDADFESLVRSLEEKTDKDEKEEPECQNLSLFDDFDDFVKF